MNYYNSDHLTLRDVINYTEIRIKQSSPPKDKNNINSLNTTIYKTNETIINEMGNKYNR